MRIPLLVLLALIAYPMAACTAAQQQEQPTQAQAMLEGNLPDEPEFVPGEVIVKMRDDQVMTTAELGTFGLDFQGRQTSGSEYVYIIPQPTLSAMAADQARDATLAAVRELSERPDVEYAQPNFILRILDTTPNDPRFGDQWHYMNNGTGGGAFPGGINLPQAWDTTTGDTSVVVSVLDTGILPGHPDITGSPNLIPGFDMITDPGMANDGDGRDGDPTDPGDACNPGDPDSWHGTHVAGTVGVGNTDNGVGVAGVNWGVSVQAVRVLGRCGGTIADINDAIRWAAGLAVPGVPTNAMPADVINMSLGGRGACSASPSIQAAIDDAVAAGAAVVVAAGNEAEDASGFVPAGCDDVITVAASDARGRLVTRYSNFGASVEIMAPGGDLGRDDSGDGNPDGVLSMVQGGYAYYNGTSMATPHVAGVLALWLASDPSQTPAQLLARLQSSALPRSSTECPQPCGAGLLNALGTASSAVTVTAVLDPDEELANGETTTVRATVRRGGAPEAGITVSFATGDASIATVSPASAVTDAAGQASSTVTGVSQGETAITATAEGVTASVPVQVPDLTVVGIVALILLLSGLALWRRRTALARS